MEIFFPLCLPLSFSMATAQVKLVSSLLYPEKRALLIGMELI